MIRSVAPETFERSYWTQDSQYRKFENHAIALAGLRNWHRGLMRLIAPHLPAVGRRHVDAGCGHGAIVHKLLERRWDAHGFDPSRWIVEQARRCGPERAERFAVDDAQDVPLDGALDLIRCLEVLEHIPEPLPALASMADRLSPGDRLVATTPNVRPLLPWRDQLVAEPTHASVHEPARSRGAIETADLRVIEFRRFWLFPYCGGCIRCCRCGSPPGRRTIPGILIVAKR